MNLLPTSFVPQVDAFMGSLTLSALAGFLPLCSFFILLGVLKVKTHWCAVLSLGVSLLIAIFGFKMPFKLALLSASEGFAFGLFPILFIIIAAVWLYNLTDESGRSADVRAAFNLVGKGDQRAQALIIAFSFCGLLEGLAGFGAPVAIVGAMLVTIGVKPVKAAMTTIVGNAINVGYGAMAIPVTTAGKLGGVEAQKVADVMGQVTPVIACFIPLILLLILDGVRGVKDLWMLALTIGVVKAGGQYLAATYVSYELTAVLASLLGFVAAAILLQIWNPRTPAECKNTNDSDLTVSRAVIALLPYWLVVMIFGFAKLWTIGIDIPAQLAKTKLSFGWPALDGQIVSMVDGKEVAVKATTFTIDTLGSPGTLLALTALIVSLVYGMTSSQGRYPFSFTQGIKTLGKTVINLRWAIVTISVVMALAYVMNLSGQTGAIGAWMAGAGLGFAFVSPLLGWIGTAVTGSATSANALFANLQSTAAGVVHVDPQLLLTANTIGGGIGKIVSPQNLAIAAGAVGQEGIEPLLLRKALPISIGLLAVLSILIGLGSMHMLWGI